MKKLIYLFVGLLMLSACKKSNYVPKFDEPPEVRMGKDIAMVRQTLTSAPNGWIATLPTGANGGYGFYLNFDDKEVLTSYADLTDESSHKEIISTYRIKQDAGVDLVFDTYTYLTWLNDPDPSTYGGAPKTGYMSDVDFIFKRVNGDSILFTGKRYRQTLTLVRATAEQQTSFKSGGYKTAIDKLKAFFVNNDNSYIDFTGTAGPVMAGVSLAHGPKTISVMGLTKDGSINLQTSTFAYTLEGAVLLNGGITYDGITFVRLSWKDATTVVFYDQAGIAYPVKNSATQLFTLDQLWGIKYSGLFSEHKTINPGTTAGGATILNYFHNNLMNWQENGSNAEFNYGYLALQWSIPNKKLVLIAFCSQNGGASGYETRTEYHYTIDANGVYTFTLAAAPSGGYMAKIQGKLHDFILKNKVKFDYSTSGDNLYGKMSSVTDPSIVMTFELY